MTHQFDQARQHLGQASERGAPAQETRRLALSVDQATGKNLDEVLAARQQIADETHSVADLVPLAALLADLGDFAAAERTYHQAIAAVHDVSPFPFALACFELGRLWGECVPEPQPNLAAEWYEQAIKYVPGYVMARVHLAEVHLQRSQPEDAEATLQPAIPSAHPEVYWRLAEALRAKSRSADADKHLRFAGSRFEDLVRRHPLAFADHAAEFYVDSGDDHPRAMELARLNLANRPTLRAFELTYRTTIAAGYPTSELLAAASKRWGHTAAFRDSLLSRVQSVCPPKSEDAAN
jgi:tetratricopeptide (TPR) repeat protein